MSLDGGAAVVFAFKSNGTGAYLLRTTRRWWSSPRGLLSWSSSSVLQRVAGTGRSEKMREQKVELQMDHGVQIIRVGSLNWKPGRRERVLREAQTPEI